MVQLRKSTHSVRSSAFTGLLCTALALYALPQVHARRSRSSQVALHSGESEPPSQVDDLASIGLTFWPKRPLPKACARAPDEPGDRRPNKDELTIGNFNAEWLFLFGGTGNMVCPGKGCPWKDRNMAASHFIKVAETITTMGQPDIVHLSEVEGCDTLDKLIGVLEQGYGAPVGAYKSYLVPGRDTALGQNVGFISKVDPQEDVARTDDRAIYPVPGSRCGWTKPGAPSRLAGSSKNYFATFLVNDIKLLLAGTHMIAYPDKPERCERREAQAAVIADVIRAHVENHPADEVLVMGDFNDYDDEILDAAGPIDTPISQALALLRKSTSPPLHNLAKQWMNQTERYTNWYDRNGDCMDSGGDEHVLIDHVLVSDGLRNRLVSTRPIHSYKEYCGTLDSDHWPIVATFNVKRQD
ncbi:hypothetical protein HDU87_005220 [Geranomyces variabilis]|uniref:Endonuclease/exonuclease/phosphatase domain-containing protein n=1 Tax=Geranomyces variabilis TaxID=109894 RepID=A0AAD5XLE6_9FUNG|nr:hypothetical protein HDU87_005220 [Geranomyces variabilis]